MPLAGSWPRGFTLTRFNHHHDPDDPDDHDPDDHDPDNPDHHDPDDSDDHDPDDPDDCVPNYAVLIGVWRQQSTRKATRFNC